MGSRFHQPVTTDHQHLAGGTHLGMRRDIDNNPYSSSFDEDTDEEIFDKPLHPYDAFPGDPPVQLQLRPALVAEEAGPRVYYASPLGGNSNRNNFSAASSLHVGTREASHQTSSSLNRLTDIQTRGRGAAVMVGGAGGERRAADDDSNKDPGKSCLDEEVHRDEDVCSSPERETQDPATPPFITVDMGGGGGGGGEKKPHKLVEQQQQLLQPRDFVENTQFEYNTINKNKSTKIYNEHNQTETAQIAEEAFSKVKFWREIFSALTGMHGVYVLANFAFDNPAGGICSLFCFLCSAFAQVDRRAPSYFLTALLSFCFGVVVTVSLGTPVRGFEAFSTNLLLRRICITQACLLLLATPVAIFLALRIIELHSFLREPGVLIPIDCTEETTEHECKDEQDEEASEEGSEQHLDNDQHFSKGIINACESQEDEEHTNTERCPSVCEGNEATTT
ncbi:uncharacterized protein EMH_0015950 [Eimeria mitis]|uniref:Transmembrane protein n=1 Tax=Eimeria mitis TaxID=44415 RepID=U6K9C5_9EIME|nr:uncharacterized protein EMH_0015950 [Eimeria mitis]CDJ33401.1 hypothetical protein, conserved [Eimeria mitis]